MTGDIMPPENGGQPEQLSLPYRMLESHWHNVQHLGGLEVLAIDPEATLDPVDTIEMSVTDIAEYEVMVEEFGGYQEFVDANQVVHHGESVRYRRDNDTGKISLGKVFFEPELTVDLGEYHAGYKESREIIIYTTDGIFFIKNQQLADLRAADRPETSFAENHWYAALEDLEPITIGQPWSVNEQRTLPPVIGVECMVVRGYTFNDVVDSFPNLGEDPFVLANDLYRAALPPRTEL